MLLEDIFTFENLYDAYRDCRKAKQHKGEVIRFETNLSLNISQLRKSLCSKKYCLGSYRQFLIFEPKKRVIEALPFKDRVVIKCFCNHILRPRVENKLIYDNAACRKNKGSSFAIKRLRMFLQREYRSCGNNNIYFLKCDVTKYFDSINHQVLINLLKQLNFSNDEMWFMKKVILEQPNKVDKGLPLGNQSSQWFALLYLNSVDRYIKEVLKVKSYIRYMDDMILIHHDKEYLKKCLYEIRRICHDDLHLLLNQKTQIGMVKNGIDFLGYRHILTTEGKIITKLRSSSKIRMKKHIKNLNHLKTKGLVDDIYVYERKNAFYNRIKNTDENQILKEKVKP